MKKIYRTALFLLAFPLWAQAQDIASVLQQIEANNKELQALKESNEAAKMEVQTRNNLEDPSIEYSPFFAKGVSGVASSEMVLRQGFDFPTLYYSRNRSGKLQQEALDMQQLATRREILLQAKNLCLDLIRLNKEQALLTERKKNADELLAFFEKRLNEGDATLIEVNKIKMERMSIQTEMSQNIAAHRTALQSLLAMNGNLPLSFSESSYPEVASINSYDALYDEVMLSDASLKAADATARTTTQEVGISKQNWLPKLEVAYRRNTSLSEASNGFLVGGSIPLFSNRKKVKIAKAQALSAQLQLENTRLQLTAQIQSQFNEMQQLKEALSVYDVQLMENTLKMLKEAVLAGQLSIIEYYVEAEGVYRNMQAYLEVENQYQKVMASIYKNRL